jgi:hypothetical protein
MESQNPMCGGSGFSADSLVIDAAFGYSGPSDGPCSVLAPDDGALAQVFSAVNEALPRGLPRIASPMCDEDFSPVDLFTKEILNHTIPLPSLMPSFNSLGVALMSRSRSVEGGGFCIAPAVNVALSEHPGSIECDWLDISPVSGLLSGVDPPRQYPLPDMSSACAPQNRAQPHGAIIGNPQLPRWSDVDAPITSFMPGRISAPLSMASSTESSSHEHSHRSFAFVSGRIPSPMQSSTLTSNSAVHSMLRTESGHFGYESNARSRGEVQRRGGEEPMFTHGALRHSTRPTRVLRRDIETQEHSSASLNISPSLGALSSSPLHDPKMRLVTRAHLTTLPEVSRSRTKPTQLVAKTLVAGES